MKFYKTKSAVVRAIFYNGENKSEVLEFTKDSQGNVEILTDREFKNRYEE